MQLTQIFSIITFVPFLALANPVAIDNSAILVRRGGKDFCGSDLKAVGQACSFGSSETQPHACDINNETHVLECRDGKWAVDHSCPVNKSCKCNRGTPLKGDLVCR
ncbi:unnamed protein product [Periconia digitata]|uniref:Uncharacterized protein n=1 Tax=Periconia digitata TaxID=1303443 RepID=A0A9W4XH85_9PLEO|nr:unnamed protein product [Periconia digitata]